MKKWSIILLGLIFAVNVSFAKEKSKPTAKVPKVQSVISGKILDKLSGEELTGVAVRLKGTDEVCYTDFEGNFQFNNLKPGEYNLDFELISYNTIKNQKIKVGSNEINELNIKLEQKK